MNTTLTPEYLLQKYWGHDQFRPVQREVIQHILAQKEALVLMPTGGGKSICYQIPALLSEGICVVVSPLLALMEDQVKQLGDRGIKALYIKSGTSPYDVEMYLTNLVRGGYKFLYLSPERLQSALVQRYLRSLPISFIAIDEAHCVSEWGHDFRPAYQKIAEVRRFLPDCPFVAFTATATTKVQEDIQHFLELRTPALFKTSYQRNNLSYGVYHTTDKNFSLLKIARKYPASMIVYVPTRQQTRDVSHFLKKHQITAAPYHGGLSAAEKKEHYTAWNTGEVAVMVATNAFGMGIDKSDVRVVVHYYIPESIEAYFQEAGRAGRDGNPAQAILLKTAGSVAQFKSKVEAQRFDVKFVKYVYRKLSSHMQVSYGEGALEFFNFSYLDFCNKYALSPTKVYTVLKILDKSGVLVFTEKYHKASRVQFKITSKQLRNFVDDNPIYYELLDFMIRKYTGIIHNKCLIDLGYIAQMTKLSQVTVTEKLEKLAAQGVLLFQHDTFDCQVQYLVPREDEFTINKIAKHIRSFLKYKDQKADKMVAFIEDDAWCKSQQLLEYFGEKSPACGVCSVCRTKDQKPKEAPVVSLESRVLGLLSHAPMYSRELEMQLLCEQDELISTLHRLMRSKKIALQPNNRYKIREQ